MAVNEGKAAPRKSQLARQAISSQHPRQVGTSGSAISHTKKPRQKPPHKTPDGIDWRGRLARFRDAVGKTVEFVEMSTALEFPCVDIGFTDRTALHFVFDTRTTIEPTYSDWRTGNQRVLRQWPPQETT